jgi:hypothetical protein
MNNAQREQFLAILENELETMRRDARNASGFVVALESDSTMLLQNIGGRAGFNVATLDNANVFRAETKGEALQIARQFGRTARVVSVRDYLANEVCRLSATIARERRTVGRLRPGSSRR